MPTERRVGKGKKTQTREQPSARTKAVTMQTDAASLQLFILFPRHGTDFGRCIIWEPVRSMAMMDLKLGKSQRPRSELLLFGSLFSLLGPWALW